MTIQPSWVIPIAPDDPSERILEKAAHVIPTPRQRAWQELELSAFVHFGVNTFTDLEWGTGLENPAIFNPSDLDARHWCRVLKEAGFRQVVLTAKHHDGFCLWPSRYTEFSVKNSPWRGGKGDVLRELSQAAAEFGLKLGIYLSPADLHEIEAPGGRYGNASPAEESVIPTPVSGDRRTPQQHFTFTVDDYNRYYLNQLYELLTEYGPVHEVWFDGANPKPGIPETYNYEDWFRLVRALAPEAVIFNGPDVRWVGNEDGFARQTEWSVLPFQGDPQLGSRQVDALSRDLGSRERLLAGADYLAWSPAEVDVSIRPGWFYHTDEDERVKDLEKLMEIYLASVGRNGLLLLNIPPDRRGRFHEMDGQRVQEFGVELRRIFQRDFTHGGQAHASDSLPGCGPERAIDGNPETFWQPPPGQTGGEWTLDLARPATFNLVLLGESLSIGQRVESFAVDAWQDGAWREIASGTTIGYKRILHLKPLQARSVRLRILQSRLNPAIRTFGLYQR